MLFTDLRFTKAEEGLPTSDFRTSNFRLPTSDFRLPTSDFTLHTSHFILRIFELRISDFWPFRLEAKWLDLRTFHFRLPTSHFRLPTSDFRPPISDFRLLISHFPLPTSDFPPLISNFRVLTSDFWLDSSVRLDCRSIHHAGINAQSQSSVERTAVPFSPQKRTTKLALEKTIKHKANPASDEVRLENRNHGLAWSQSGNNKTVQTLAVNLILACITGALWAKLGERGILREARNECEALRS